MVTSVIFARKKPKPPPSSVPAGSNRPREEICSETGLPAAADAARPPPRSRGRFPAPGKRGAALATPQSRRGDRCCRRSGSGPCPRLTPRKAPASPGRCPVQGCGVGPRGLGRRAAAARTDGALGADWEVLRVPVTRGRVGSFSGCLNASPHVWVPRGALVPRFLGRSGGTGQGRAPAGRESPCLPSPAARKALALCP